MVAHRNSLRELHQFRPSQLFEELRLPDEYHLQKLIQVDLVTQERQATTLICRANYPVMEALVGFLTEECCVEEKEKSCRPDAA